MSVVKEHGYQLSISLENRQEYSVIFIGGSLDEIKQHEPLFEQLSEVTKSENVFPKEKTEEIDFTLMNNYPKLFVRDTDSLQMETKGEKTYITHKMSGLRILAWSPILAFMVFFWLPLAFVPFLYATSGEEFLTMLGETLIGMLFFLVVPLVPILIFSIIGYLAPGGYFQVRMSRIVIDMTDYSITWEHKRWPRFFTKKETIKWPVSMSLESGYYTFFEGDE